MSDDDDYLPSIGGATPTSPSAARTPPAQTAVTREQAGRYDRQREIGRGGIGRVWLGFDRHIGREVAIKELLDPGARIATDPSPADGVGPSESDGSSAFVT
ncbi:MAG: hypothetical protein AAFY60_22165, partial [Myxococcota bacterium]